MSAGLIIFTYFVLFICGCVVGALAAAAWFFRKSFKQFTDLSEKIEKGFEVKIKNEF